MSFWEYSTLIQCFQNYFESFFSFLFFPRTHTLTHKLHVLVFFLLINSNLMDGTYNNMVADLTSCIFVLESAQLVPKPEKRHGAEGDGHS